MNVAPNPAPEAVLEVCVAGLLRAPAAVFYRGGHTIVRLVVAQHLQRHPEARHVYADFEYPAAGDDNATHIAAVTRASEFQAGTETLLRGTGLVPSTLHGEPVLRLLDCTAFCRIERTLHPTIVQPGGNHVA
ncbi:hypothetical protein [Aquincola sp. J276]|uniref:hypothetical protein n=1 Tax=Aquincola sp. J276 TaxID=2898432 RepID=UPI002150DB3F|nr:hypothetical protein [Aquincola sp. J276]MCR5864674.1 hypothetical protein [Aquincola sp. J276]